MLHTRTSTYQSQIIFFVKPLQNQESPSKKCANAYTYGFNGQERVNELNSSTYNFGARMYDARVGRFFSTDLLKAKYPSLSSYSFCASNPIMLMDIDGNEIWISIGKNKLQYKNDKLYTVDGKEYKGNNKFAKQSLEALNYIKKYDDKDVINTLEKSKNVVTLKTSNVKRNNNSRFYRNNNELKDASELTPQNLSEISATISWNPDYGLKVNEKPFMNSGVQAPSTALFHEAVHVFRLFSIADKTDPVAKNLDLNKFKQDQASPLIPDPNAAFKNTDEYIVVNEYETPYINRVNEQYKSITDYNKKQGTRNWHNAGPGETPESMSVPTTGVNEVSPKPPFK